ncbi:hypothetical protein Hypma_009222 [Hypsizygus marmoreus]|uniref:F-box domain-containing protein n=1 Tax=Hypsizygus marmoreus TaxID=39966 RepID=A0A369JNN9_HYPMA|nr:hypothetical protein Hypma_009222 [Hypsizygus marmoreus]
MFPVIPVELFEGIITELGDDFPALKVCSFASRDFLSFCRPKLFSKITIYGITSPIILRRSVSICDAPHLSFYVRDLRITRATSNNIDIAANLTRLDVDAFVSVLRSLPRLRALFLSNFGFGERWTQLPAQIRAAFTDTFALPTLVRLTLDDAIRLPPSFFSLSSIRGIKHLDLLGVKEEPFPDTSTMTPYVSSEPLKLRSLAISLVLSAFSSSLEKAIDFTEAHQMVIRCAMMRGEHYADWKLLGHAASLKYLSISTGWNLLPPAPRPDGIDLAQLRHLRSLILRVGFNLYPMTDAGSPEEGACKNPLHWIIEVLSTLGPSNTVLEDVEITLETPSILGIFERDGERWADLDRILSGLECSSLTIHSTDSHVEMNLPSLVRTLLPTLWQKRGGSAFGWVG